MQFIRQLVSIKDPCRLEVINQEDMKKIAMFVCAFALIGTGCTTTVNVSEDTRGDQDDSVEEMDDVMDGEPQVELEVTDPTAAEEVVGDGFDPAPGTAGISLKAGNFFFEPATVRVGSGDEVTLDFVENTGVHTFVIDEIGLNVPIKEGATTTFTAPTEPGTYAFYCDIGNHRALGMEGVLIVK